MASLPETIENTVRTFWFEKSLYLSFSSIKKEKIGIFLPACSHRKLKFYCMNCFEGIDIFDLHHCVVAK